MTKSEHEQDRKLTRNQMHKLTRKGDDRTRARGEKQWDKQRSEKQDSVQLREIKQRRGKDERREAKRKLKLLARR